MKNNRLKNDLLLAAVIIAVALVAAGIFLLSRKEGGYATVIINGKETARYSLEVDRSIEIKTGENGDDYNILVIKDGSAHVEDASCRDRICANHRAIKYSGETITCLPHKVVIRIDAPDQGGVDVDA